MTDNYLWHYLKKQLITAYKTINIYRFTSTTGH